MRRTIDLHGPEGNAFALLGTARQWAKDLEKDSEAILNEMQSSDYTHLVAVFHREFCSGETAVAKLENLPEDFVALDDED